jgi:tRNA threonylcarbamoyl adenosine modification protein (Sua5/YciO/YrdC/YwlC family)
MLLKLYEENPSEKHLKTIVECLQDGGIIIYPTDTVYSFGCDIYKQKAVERIARLKGLDPKRNNFSIVCRDLSNLSDYSKPIANHIFRIMRKAFPGPYTFILPANSRVPKLFQHKKKTVGIRVPDNGIAQAIVADLGNPILSTSLHHEDKILDCMPDPEDIYDAYKDKVDIVIDGGPGGNIPSTIIDCSSDEIEIIREGLGDTSIIY